MLLVVYLLVIGMTGCVMLGLDKHWARKDKWRIEEYKLHVLELLGGVWLMLPCMYLIRHKTSKFAYYIWTWSMLGLWLSGLILGVFVLGQ